MNAQDLASKLKDAGIDLFKDRSGFPTSQAQRNLEGKCNYADDSVMRSAGTSVLSCDMLDDGLILGIVEQVQKGRSVTEGYVYRPVFFDVFGNVIFRPANDEASANRKQAQALFWQKADEFNAVDITLDGLKKKQIDLQQTTEIYKKLLADLQA